MNSFGMLCIAAGLAFGAAIAVFTFKPFGIGAANAYKTISPNKAKQMIEEGGVVIVDVRTDEEFAEGHIEGAVLLPDYEIVTLAPENLPDKSQTLLVYCRSGKRSANASQALADLGYENVYNFGGIIDWPYETVR